MSKVQVTTDEIPLTDERSIRAIVQRLDLPLEKGAYEPKSDEDVPTEVRGGLPSRRSFWDLYFYSGRTRFAFKQKRDVWLTVDEDAGVLRRLVISGLAGEKEAEVLRSDVWRSRLQSEGPAGWEEVERIALNVVANRKERAASEAFSSCLRRLGKQFRWEGETVLEGPGTFLPISETLPAHEVELLRQVYALLPKPNVRGPYDDQSSSISVDVEACPSCGRGRSRVRADTPLKEMKKARDRISDEGFRAWTDTRLADVDKAGVWSQSGALYADYVDWITTKAANQTNTIYAETKTSVMTSTAWGRKMGVVFAKGRAPGTNVYNVRLKKKRQLKLVPEVLL